MGGGGSTGAEEPHGRKYANSRKEINLVFVTEMFLSPSQQDPQISNLTVHTCQFALFIVYHFSKC
jgi:hypothetical protein